MSIVSLIAAGLTVVGSVLASAGPVAAPSAASFSRRAVRITEVELLMRVTRLSRASLVHVTVAVPASVMSIAAPARAQLALAPSRTATAEITGLERLTGRDGAPLAPDTESRFRVRWAFRTLPGAAVENSTVVLEGQLSDGTTMTAAPITVLGQFADLALPTPPAGVEFDAFTVRVTGHLDSEREGYPNAEDMNGQGITSSAARTFRADHLSVVE